MHSNSNTVPSPFSLEDIIISDWVNLRVIGGQNALVDWLRNEQVWLTWAKQISKDKKKTKVPAKIQGGILAYVNATDIDKLGTYEAVAPMAASVAALGIDCSGGLGVSVRHLPNIELVDFDHCVQGDVFTNSLIQAFVEASGTYAEYSPSGTGLRLAFEVIDGKPAGFKRHIFDTKRDDVQIQTNCTFFTITGNIFRNLPVRLITQKELLKLYALVGVTNDPPSLPAVVPSQSDRPSIAPSLGDAELLKKMFTAKNSDKVEALYNGEMSDRNNGDPAADLSLCSRLAFWTGKDAERMDRIFRTSKLLRPKWDEKRGNTTYGRMTIGKAIEGCRDIYTRASNTDYLTSDGKTLLVLENICRVLERDDVFRNILRLNDFSSMVEMYDKESGNWVLLSDGFIFEAIRHVSITYPGFVRVSKGMMTDAILAVANKTKVNPPKNYLLSLQWDGGPRLDSWLHYAYGAPDDKIHHEIGENWMKGLVLRIMRPGCQFDHVLVLEAKQGWKKSSSLRVLGAPWHVEVTASPDSKDFFMILAQNTIVEFSEGDIVSRTDVKKLKGIITKIQDQVRLPYARGVSTLKRGCVFAMTTNDTEYLKDETGNRRWLPVKLEKIADVDWVRENRDQLYAEAYHRAIELGEKSYEYSDDDLLKDMQESRRERNEYEEDIISWYLGLPQERRDAGIRAKEVYNEVINPGAAASDFRDIPRIMQLQITGMLQGALHLENKNVKIKKVVLNRWLPTEQTVKRFDFEKRDTNW